MKTIVAILLCSLTIYSLPAMADCPGEVTAVLDAMRAAGPIRREMEFYREGTLETKTVSDFSPPDQLIETANSVQGNYLSTVSVSGKTAWSAMKHAGDPDQPIQEFDGSAYIEEAKTFRMPPYPITECPIDDGELQLVWTASDGERSQKVTAKADANSHVMKTLDIITKLKNGTIETEEHNTFNSIPAFSVKPPKNAVKVESGPTYAKIADIDPTIPMPPDAEKIIYSKGIEASFYSQQKIDALSKFYRSKYKELGWKEEDSKSKDTSFEAKFIHSTQGWVLVEIETRDQSTHVSVNGPYPNQ